MRHIDWKLVGQTALVLGLAAGVIVLVIALRATAPTEQEPSMLVGAEDPLAPDSDIVTCRRRLPDVTAIEAEDLEEIEPVGRATSSEIIECPDLFDQQVITFTGEVIGDLLRRDGGAWVLMNDDAYALEGGPLPGSGMYDGYNSGISVWLDEELVDLVEHGGGPDWRGTVLRVRAQVERTDPDDGGGLTLRAFTGEVVGSARRLDHPIHWLQLIAAGVLGLVALGFVGWERAVARRR